jgi:hypothetical protein
LFEKGLQTYRRLGRGLILRHLTTMGLCETRARHFDARIHQKAIVEIQTHHAMHTTLPILARTKEIQRRRTVPSPTRYFAEVDRQQNKKVQKIVGSILYYARAVDMTVLMALSSIASEQTKGTERTLEKAYQFLDYLVTHPNAVVRFLRIRHGDEHTFRRVVFKQTGSKKQSMWTFFSWAHYQRMAIPSN